MGDSDVGKLFVGGISRETSDVTLKSHFTKYGQVSSSIIAKDRLTGLPRGFGFVTFSDASAFQLALRDHHVIDGRVVEVKRAIPRNEQQSNTQQQPPQQSPHRHQHYSQGYHTYTSNRGYGRNTNAVSSNYGVSNNDQSIRAKKIFVGGLSADITEEEFKGYFEKFGRITDVVVMHDNTTNRPRGFGFITFDSEEVVEKLVRRSDHELGGKRVEVKKAVPRDASKSFNNGHNSRFGGGRFSPVPGFPDESSWVRGPAAYVNYSGQYPLPTAYPGCYYGGAYPYGVYGYGMPVVPPSGPSNGVGMMGYRPVHYGTGYYSTGNGGVALVGMFNGYNSYIDTRGNMKQDQDINVSANAVLHAKDASRQTNGSNSHVDNSGAKMGKGVVNVKKTSTVPDAQVQQSMVAPVSQSS